MEDGSKPQFRVDVVDNFQGFESDDFWEHGRFETLAEAIAAARRITERSIRECKSFKKWRDGGQAGVVYGPSRQVLWDGAKECARERKGRGSGFRR